MGVFQTHMSQTRLEWWTPVMGRREKELLCEVIDKGFPNDGEYSDRFADEIARICGTQYALAVTSGTAALALALMACGVGAGDEVIVPDVTFIATANAVTWTGATPVLADVDPETFMLDVQDVERKLTPRTKALIPVHVSGRPAALPELIALASAHKLYVIEDAAEALGSSYNGRALGAWGDAGCFSFSPAKTITTGQGGAIVTDSPEIYQRLRLLKDQGRPVRGTGGADEHVALGFNFKFTNLQAAMGLAQLEDFQERLEHQRQLYDAYAEALPNHPRLRLLSCDIRAGVVPQWIDIWVDGGRDSLHDFLVAENIFPRKFWYPLHTQAPYRQSDAAFPCASQVSFGGLWLPSALTLTREDVERVCAVIGAWLEA
jgi:perosamine synthetase